MMDKKAIRKANLRLLLSQYTGVELAARAETNPKYLINLASAKSERNIGYKVARRLEAAAGEAEGWMDQPRYSEWQTSQIKFDDLNLTVPGETGIEQLDAGLKSAARLPRESSDMDSLNRLAEQLDAVDMADMMAVIERMDRLVRQNLRLEKQTAEIARNQERLAAEIRKLAAKIDDTRRLN